MTSGHVLQQLESRDGAGQRTPATSASSELAATGRGTRSSRKQSIRCSGRAEIAASGSRRAWNSSRLRLPRRSNWQCLRENGAIDGADCIAERWPAWPRSKSGIVQRHRCCSESKSLVSEMTERVSALRTQIESAVAEKLQREIENQELAEQAGGSRCRAQCLRSPRRPAAGRIRTGPRPPDGDRRGCCSRPAQLLDQSRDRRAELSAAAAKLQSDAQYMARNLPERTWRCSVSELMADTTLPRSSPASNLLPKTRSIARCARGSMPWARST